MNKASCFDLFHAIGLFFLRWSWISSLFWSHDPSVTTSPASDLMARYVYLQPQVLRALRAQSCHLWLQLIKTPSLQAASGATLCVVALVLETWPAACCLLRFWNRCNPCRCYLPRQTGSALGVAVWRSRHSNGGFVEGVAVFVPSADLVFPFGVFPLRARHAGEVFVLHTVATGLQST